MPFDRGHFPIRGCRLVRLGILSHGRLTCIAVEWSYLVASDNEIKCSMPLGVVLRRSAGVTPWAEWSWKAVGVIPGAPAADWHLLRRDGESCEYHAATRTLTLWRTDTEAYLTALADNPPSIYVIMREQPSSERPFDILMVTASPFEAQDYCDSAEEIVERVPISVGLIAWICDFIDAHHTEVPFVKRRRDKLSVYAVENGKGDARVNQLSDVYRSPEAQRKAQGR